MSNSKLICREKVTRSREFPTRLNMGAFSLVPDSLLEILTNNEEDDAQTEETRRKKNKERTKKKEERRKMNEERRRIYEERRQKSEERRVEKEERRADVEDRRNMNHRRVKNEEQRMKIEERKNKTEERRKKNEARRMKKEEGRKKEEERRLKYEDHINRMKNEDRRKMSNERRTNKEERRTKKGRTKKKEERRKLVCFKRMLFKCKLSLSTVMEIFGMKLDSTSGNNYSSTDFLPGCFFILSLQDEYQFSIVELDDAEYDNDICRLPAVMLQALIILTLITMPKVQPILQTVPLNVIDPTRKNPTFNSISGGADNDSIKKTRKRKKKKCIGRIRKKPKIEDVEAATEEVEVDATEDDTELDGKSERRKASQKKYELSQKGKDVKQKYRLSQKGKATRQNYEESEEGTARQHKYEESEKARATRKKYANSEKGRAARLRYRNNLKPELVKKLKNKYMKNYREKVKKSFKAKSTEKQVHVDFSSIGSCSNTHILQKHEPSAEMFLKYQDLKKNILLGRRYFKNPFTTGLRGFGSYKVIIADVFEKAMAELHLDDKSLKSAGIPRKNLKKKHFNAVRVASKKLAEAVFLKREQCVSQLKMSANKLKSLAEGILATVALTTKEKEKEVALLGLQHHHKASEPYFLAVSYKDRDGYDYAGKAEEREEKDAKAKEAGKSTEDWFYRCTENCILFNKDEKLDFLKLVKELAEMDTAYIRKFVQNYSSCTKYDEYTEDVGSDLDPSRMYMYPVKRRNHPQECYMPLLTKRYKTDFHKCRSNEVLLRRAMVHYENARKLNMILQEASKSHKLLCDIDTSTMLGDLLYLSKINKVMLKPACTVSEQGSSEARLWTSATIEAKLSEPVASDKRKKKATYIEVFQKECSNLPKIKCWSCNILETPSGVHVINVNTWKALKFDPEKNRHPNSAYQSLHDFLLEKGLLDDRNNREEDEEEDEDREQEEALADHPTKLLHGLEICNYCYNCFRQDKIPARSLMNNMYTGECPTALKDLNPIEMMFVSRVKCFQTVIKGGPISCKLPASERINAVKGHFIHLPLSTAETFKRLRGENNNNLFDVQDLVHCYGKPKKDKTVWRHLVDRKKVYYALKCLCDDNKMYKDIVLPEKPEDILPDVFGNDDDEESQTYQCPFCSKDSFVSREECTSHEEKCAREFIGSCNEDELLSFLVDSDGEEKGAAEDAAVKDGAAEYAGRDVEQKKKKDSTSSAGEGAAVKEDAAGEDAGEQKEDAMSDDETVKFNACGLSKDRGVFDDSEEENGDEAVGENHSGCGSQEGGAAAATKHRHNDEGSSDDDLNLTANRQTKHKHVLDDSEEDDDDREDVVDGEEDGGEDSAVEDCAAGYEDAASTFTFKPLYPFDMVDFPPGHPFYSTPNLDESALPCHGYCHLVHHGIDHCSWRAGKFTSPTCKVNAGQEHTENDEQKEDPWSDEETATQQTKHKHVLDQSEEDDDDREDMVDGEEDGGEKQKDSAGEDSAVQHAAGQKEDALSDVETEGLNGGSSKHRGVFDDSEEENCDEEVGVNDCGCDTQEGDAGTAATKHPQNDVNDEGLSDDDDDLNLTANRRTKHKDVLDESEEDGDDGEDAVDGVEDVVDGGEKKKDSASSAGHEDAASTFTFKPLYPFDMVHFPPGHPFYSTPNLDESALPCHGYCHLVHHGIDHCNWRAGKFTSAKVKRKQRTTAPASPTCKVNAGQEHTDEQKEDPWSDEETATQQTKHDNVLNDSEEDSDDGEDVGEKKKDSASSDYNDKPWIRRMTTPEIARDYVHFTVTSVSNEIEDATEVFKTLDIGSRPVKSYAPDLDCNAFPVRFPLGEGGRTAARKIPISDTFFEQAHVMTSDPYHRRNQQYLFFNVQQRERRKLGEGVYQVTNSKDGSTMTKGDMANAAKMRNPELLKKVSNLLRNLPSQKEFWNDARRQGEQMISEYGPATLWLTLSPGEYDDEDLHRYLKEMNPDLDDKLTTTQLVCQDPVLACTYLQTKFDATLKYILSEAEPFGKVVHYAVRTEYQSRFMVHFHTLLWIDGAPIMGINSDEEVLEFINKIISCKLPSTHEDPALHNLVKRFQYHRCNSYCLRSAKNGTGKARCKFSFPREARFKPVLHSVLSSTVSRQSRSYQRRLYEIERKKCEERINDYNPILMKLWKGNMDIQFIGEESETLVDYICKYATKAPKSAVDDFHIENMVDASDHSKLLSLAMRMMGSREMGAMEARNFLLSEDPFKTDATFQRVNAVYLHKRKRMLKRGKQLSDLADDSSDIYLGNLLSTWYPERPKSLEAMSVYEFVRTYKRASANEAATTADKSRLLKLNNNHGYMIKRTLTKKHPYPVIVYGPTHLDPVTDKEEFHYSHLVMHKTWRKDSDVKGTISNSYEAEYNRLKEEIPALGDSVKKALRRRRMQDEWRKKVDEEVAKDQQKPEDDDPTVSEGPNGSDCFDNIRKQTSIETEEQLEEAIASLSEDQLRVYKRFVDDVEHYHAHQSKPPTCECTTYEPIRLYVSGFAGSGKSYLIRTLMGYQYVKSEVRKEPCHLLLGAPTGIASCNVCGQTLHSMWNLPVEHNGTSEYKTLSAGIRNRIRGNYFYACGHIMDEISMISNKMLMYISVRMQEVFGVKTQTFGGLPVIVFGDMFQLEPPKAKPAYVKLTPDEASQFGRGFSCAPDLWKSFKYEKLTTNHRQEGDENAKWRDVLSRVRFGMLNEDDVAYLYGRLIDVGDCKNTSERLDAFVTKFLECEEKGLNPVCLLPKRSMCDEYNKAIMARKEEKPIRIFAKDRLFCSRSKRPRVEEKLQKMDQRDTAGLDKTLDIAVNTRVMLRINDKRTPGLVNGARGTVQELVMDSSGETVTKIIVKFDDIEEVQCIERKELKFRAMPGCYVYRSMFPLINSYAMTIHKSQSLSLACVFADLGSEIFCSGMSYVALSRCTSYDGLHLMNFNPVKVKASARACQEYARMFGLLDQKFNKGSKLTGWDRIWCSSSAQRKATKTTAEEIKKEKKKRKNPFPGDTEAKKTRTNTATDGEEPPRKQKKRKPPVAQPKDKQKAKKTRKDPVPGRNDDQNQSVSITRVVNRPMNYSPVSERWQRTICNAFGWNFTERSTTGAECRQIATTRRPVHETKATGDGHCWYRTIAHIVTGDQEDYRIIKEAVLQYMSLNVDLLQNVFRENCHYAIPTDSRILYSETAAKRYIDFHRDESGVVPWADQIVMSFTSCLFKTPYYLYDIYNGWTSVSWGSACPIWPIREHMMAPSAAVADLQPSQEGMYIWHVNRVHFDPAHDGLQPQNRRETNRVSKGTKRK